MREATGEAAYAAGHYAEALAELRAAKRMNGATAYLPIMADCHRALGHPEQALKLAKSPSVANFAPAAKAEMTIVEAGARRDLGQLDAALRTLELAPLNSKSRAAVGGAAALRLRRHPRGRGPRDTTRWRGSTAPTPSTATRSPTPRRAPTPWSAARPSRPVWTSHAFRWSSGATSVTMVTTTTSVSLRVASSQLRDRWGRRISTPGVKEADGDHTTAPAPRRGACSTSTQRRPRCARTSSGPSAVSLALP